MTTGMESGAGSATGGQQGERVQEAVSGLVDQATRTAEARASTTMTKAGDTLDQVARAIREAGSGLREQQPEIAGFVDTAAEQVESASSYLREHGARETFENVQRMARQQPALVVGGGLALGLLVGRFLRSSSPESSGGSGGYGFRGGYGSGGYGSAGYGSAGYGAGGASGYGPTAGYGSTGSYGETRGIDGAAGTGYSSSGYETGASGIDRAGFGAAGAGTLGVAATDTLRDETGSTFATGTSSAGSDLGSGSDIGLSDDFATSDTTAVDRDDILGDDESGTGAGTRG